jgi:hypothetical protein
LTPPNWDAERGTEKHKEAFKVRRYTWDFIDAKLKQYQPFDFTAFVGDAIDGKGERSGGTEQLYMDRDDQAEMSVDIFKRYKLGDIFMAYGTPYHTGKSEDWERQIAREVGAVKIGGEDDIEVNGAIINYKHHIGRSSIEHGKHTAIAKDRLHNLLWAERGEFPKANVLVRAHVHYYKYAGGFDWVAMTLPASCAYGGKYGTRIMSGLVDCGFVIVEIDKNGGVSWKPIRLLFQLKRPISV